MPVMEQIFTLEIPSGVFQSIEGALSNTADIISFQIGEAPVTPEAIWLIGELSLFPTQVATRKFWLYPIVQLSLRSLLVPVLTATSGWFLITRYEFNPNSGARA